MTTDFRIHPIRLDGPATSTLTEDQVAALAEHVPKSWNYRADFMLAVGDAVSMYGYKPHDGNISPAQLKKHLKKIDAASLKLFQAIRKTPRAVWAFTDILAAREVEGPQLEGAVPSVDIPSILVGRVTPILWRLKEVNLSSYADQVKTGKHVQPKATAARQICDAIAIACASQPTWPTQEWFVGFMEYVLKYSGLKGYGRDTARAAFNRAKKTSAV